MGLRELILADMKSAMREKNRTKLDALRLLRAAIQRKELDDQQQLDDKAVLQVVEKMLKQGKDSITQFTKGGRDDLVAKEVATIEVLQHYLPEQLSQQEVEELIRQAISETAATTIKDMGKVMALIKPQVQGKADMGQVSGFIKSLLD